MPPELLDANGATWASRKAPPVGDAIWSRQSSRVALRVAVREGVKVNQAGTVSILADKFAEPATATARIVP